MVMANVFGQEPFQMAFVEHDDMVEQIATTGADGALGHAVLPGALVAGSLGFNAEALDRRYDPSLKFPQRSKIK